MYRLNIKVSEEAAAILKSEANRIGCGMGTIVTLWALDKKKENDALGTMAIYKAEMEKQTKAMKG